MRPTRPLLLLAIAVVAGALSYAVIHLWNSRGTIPGVPASAPVVLAVIALILLATGLAFRARLAAFRAAREAAFLGRREPQQREMPRPLDPLQAARAVVLAKASALVGALVIGVYGGYAVFLLPHLDIAPWKTRAITCGFAAAAGLAMVLTALFLERVLRVPPDEDSPSSTSTT